MTYNANNTGRTQFSSWGRTRQPKNVAGGPYKDKAGNIIAPQAAPKNKPAGDDDMDVVGSYSTENQRFLHLLLETSGDRTRNIVVYGYSHAMGRWAPLTDTSGNTITTGNIQNVSTYKIFEIHGVDRVYFFSTSNGSAFAAWNSADFFFAATSTF